MEQEAEPLDPEDPIGDAVRTVAQSLADANRMLRERAKEFGIDIDEALNDPELEEAIERRRAFVRGQDAVELAKKYSYDARAILETNNETLVADDDPMAAEMLEIVHWYVFFIAAKTHRGYHGVVDTDGYEDTDALSDLESDANGSIKIALIAIERSILAWTYLLSTTNQELIRPLIDQLETVKAIIERKFPNAREFVRPGFDEIETVM